MRKTITVFVKIFAQILDSSLANDYQVRHVFEDLLKLCDKEGVLDMTPEAIARHTNAPVEIVKRALAELEKPDPESRSPEFEGRRIIRLDGHREWGWRITNFRRYLESSTKEMLRMSETIRKRAYRTRYKNKFSGVEETPSLPIPLSPSEGEREKDPSGDLSRTVPDLSRTEPKIPVSLNTQEFIHVWHSWMQWRRKKKSCQDFEGLFTRQIEWLAGFPVKDAIEIMATSMRNDWQGLFPLKGKSETRQHDRNAGTANEGVWGEQYNSAAALKSQQKAGMLPGIPDVQ